MVGRAPPTPSERRGLAGIVEVYRCGGCGGEVRFPRYNDPVTLLAPENRKGRCGEWANAFAAVAAGVGYRVRHVVDFTDHVWVEVWAPLSKRWVHVDPCEGAVDTPLLYESGWGKKLSYIFAFAAEGGTVDVIRRYTRKHEEVLARRTQVPEGVCAALVNASDWDGCGSVRPPGLVAERVAEEEEMASGGGGGEGLGGRVSGALEWRVARGEV